MSAESKVRQHMGTQTEVSGVDRIIAELAEGQHAVVGRAQLLKLGLGREGIGHRVRCARLHPVYRGVYAVGHRLLSREGRWMAAILAMGGEGVLSHRSAAALWGIRDGGELPEVTVPHWRPARPGLRVYSSSLAEDERTRHLNIPVTSVSRTLLDLAAVLPRPRLELAIDRAEALELADPLPLAALLDCHSGRRGAATLRAILHEGAVSAQTTASELENRFWAFIRGTDLPRPRVNLPIEAAARRFVADIAWPSARLIVELDSRGFHDTALAFESDRARDRALLAAGWRVIRITSRQLRNERAALLADLTRLLLDPPAAEP
jgi:very-short-patch-repair endonuclease